MPTRLVSARLAAAILTTAAASLGLVATSSAPADAAACSGSRGVTVVVDHGALGSGITQACNASGGGKSGTTQFTSTGFSLTYVQRQPGFVCRIDAQPASDPCVNTPPADAYWGLWWSDGKSGSWSYSSVAAGSLTIPDGGYVAFAWQSGTRTAPGVPATAHGGSSAPTRTPSATPTTKPSHAPSAPTSPTRSPSGGVTVSTPTPSGQTEAPVQSPTQVPTSASTQAPTGPDRGPDRGSDRKRQPAADALGPHERSGHTLRLAVLDPHRGAERRGRRLRRRSAGVGGAGRDRAPGAGRGGDPPGQTA